MTPGTSSLSGGRKASSIIALLCGFWLLVSPWVFNTDTQGTAYDSWIVGGLLVILAAFELSTPSLMGLLSWISCLLGIWIIASPWMFAYPKGSGRFINYLCIGVIVLVASIRNAMSPPHPSVPTPMGR
jgi:hypothetical protein